MKNYLLSLCLFASTSFLASTIQMTISESGVYHLTQDLEGTLSINAKEVFLDMNGFTIDALQAEYGIVAHGHSVLHISNGFIRNSLHTGIHVTDRITSKQRYF